MLELKRAKLVKELNKNEKFSIFLAQTQTLFNQESLDYQDIQQAMNSYESLILMVEDTRMRLDYGMNILSRLKCEFSNVIQCESDQFVRDHDMVQQLKSDRDEMEMKNLIFNENLNERIDLVNKKTIEFDLITKSINNIYDLLNKKLSLRSTNKRQFRIDCNPTNNDVKCKLKFIKDKLDDLKQMYVLLRC
jgi:hypothetical protein